MVGYLDFWVSRKLLFLVLDWKIDRFCYKDFSTKLEGSDEVNPQYQITGYLEKLFLEHLESNSLSN